MQDEQQALWRPSASRVAGSHQSAFTRLAETLLGRRFADYPALWRMSVDEPAAFWSLLWDYGEVMGTRGHSAFEVGDTLRGAQFFPQARLNYAENLLRHNDNRPALLFRGEDRVARSISSRELNQWVSQWQQAMAAAGVREGERVASLLPNLPESVAAMLAAASVGAIWSACAPDADARTVQDLLGPLEPKLLLVADGYWRDGKAVESGSKLAGIVAGLPSVERVVVVPYLDRAEEVSVRLPKSIVLAHWLALYPPAPLSFLQLPFRHPLCVIHDGTDAGKPRAHVHGHGGTLLQHLKEHQLHCDIHERDVLFFCSGSHGPLWHWQLSALASGATLILYDGNPQAGDGTLLWEYADSAGCTHFGAVPAYLETLQQLDFLPGHEYPLKPLRALLSSGGPLTPQLCNWLYQALKPDLHLGAMLGGRGLLSHLALGSPCLPVWAGELQCRGLGMALEIYDEHGLPLRGAKGELVCTRPFPALPIGLWQDADGEKYHKAYFNRFPGIWSHGGHAEFTPHGGVIDHGQAAARLASPAG